MTSSKNDLTFAIKAVNESQDALRESQRSIEDLTGEVRRLGDELEPTMAQLTAEIDASGIRDLDDLFGNLEQTLIGVKDIYGVAAEQFGLKLPFPMEEWTAAAADVAGGLEGVIAGGRALVQQFGPMLAQLPPLIASTWAYVSALIAQAAAFIAANAPIIAIVAGIALLAAGVLLLIKYWDEIVAAVPGLKPAIEGVTGFFTKTAIPAFDDLKGAIEVVYNWVKDNWPLIAAIISGPFAPLVLLATDAFGIRSALIGAFKSVIEDIKGLVTGAIDAGKAFGGAVKDGILEGLGAIVDSAGDIAADFIKALRQGWNNAIQWADDHFKLHIPGVTVKGVTIIPDVDFDPDLSFAKLAAGGIVTRPTLALIGEAGPEAVVPLGRGPIGGNTIHITVQGSVWSLDELVYELQRRGVAV